MLKNEKFLERKPTRRSWGHLQGKFGAISWPPLGKFQHRPEKEGAAN